MTNPVIPGFHPDPSVCRVGEHYFLVTSSFSWFPGVPIFASPNLVDWTQIGNVLDRPSQLDLEHTADSATLLGAYAPTIRYHDDRFWVITTIVGTDRVSNFFVRAADPAGPWSDPVSVGIAGIDPDLAWDGEGRCWVHFSGLGGIARVRIDDETGKVLEGPDRTWSGTGLQYPEAPHLVARDGTWYLILAEGGTERGHAVSIARSPSPTGPWESNPANPVLSHRSTDHPIQNTGHADLVEAPDGSWWLVALGVRPMGSTPGFHVLGRETFLAPVAWKDGWPVVGPMELELAERPPGPAGRSDADPDRDDFDGPDLAPRWMALRRPLEQFCSLQDRPGWLTVTAGPENLESPTPAMVARRQQHHHTRTRTRVDAGRAAEAGLTLFMDGTAHYEVAVLGDEIVAKATIGPLASVLGRAARPEGPLVLTVETVPDRAGPDRVRLGYEADGETRLLAELDGRYLSTEVTGGFTGRVIGVYAVEGRATFDWFDYEGTA